MVTTRRPLSGTGQPGRHDAVIVAAVAGSIAAIDEWKPLDVDEAARARTAVEVVTGARVVVVVARTVMVVGGTVVVVVVVAVACRAAA
jgi:hypothetical protein